MKVLITGGAGFIGGYLTEELLSQGHTVVVLDNLSKYGPVARAYDSNPRYSFVQGDAKDSSLLTQLVNDCEHLVAGAAVVGGVPILRRYPYGMLAENERITLATCDAAIAAHKTGRLKKVTWISSSMVYEGADPAKPPSREGDERLIPPPISAYGFQKLAVEYAAQAAWQQHGLPFTVIRPFNAVGAGERKALNAVELTSGNIRLVSSHVIPDLIYKVLAGQNPLHLLGDGKQIRHFTYAGDLARGIAVSLAHPAAENEAFNFSSPEPSTIKQVAAMIWAKIHGPDVPLRLAHEPPYPDDVRQQRADVSKTRDCLGFEASTTLSDVLDEVIAWTKLRIAAGD